MTETTPRKHRAHIVRDFTDAGTGETFAAGSTVLIEAGAFGNYAAAGLVRAPDADAGKTADAHADDKLGAK